MPWRAGRDSRRLCRGLGPGLPGAQAWAWSWRGLPEDHTGRHRPSGRKIMTMTHPDLRPFEAARPHLINLAYRMLGERAAAEDVVQPGAWLRQVTARLSVD